MDMGDFTTALAGLGAPVYAGYPATGASLPYIVHRPYLIDVPNSSVTGSAIALDHQQAIYCCGASVEASFNLAKLVMSALHGKKVGGVTMATTMGYAGASVEGHYETQVTAQGYEKG